MRRTHSFLEEEVAFHAIFGELSNFLAPGKTDDADAEPPPNKTMKQDYCNSANRVVWQASSVLSNARPCSSFVVYNKDGDVDMSAPDTPPLFDGSVANATPPPLGAFGAGGVSGGHGTILHLSCAVDSPLALAILLVLGGDARASHTAFRRLMIHEAACCGSLQCLTLLLELGQECSTILASSERKRVPAPRFPLFPDDRIQGSPQCSTKNRLSQRDPVTFEEAPSPFMPILTTIRDTIYQVRQGAITELDAARSLAALARLPDVSRMSLARSCSFSPTSSFGSFVHSQGWADGHGNTPLHWAAFKNEAECVSLLLRKSADANARAQPSGWTPLHDAAYSNSFHSVKLLLEAGAEVDIRANSGATPLCFAAQENAAEAAYLLLERGADITTRCAGAPRGDLVAAGPHAGDHANHGRFSGYTPLHYCAHYNAHRAARVLLAHPSAQAAMEIPDLSERLPIHIAVARASSDVLRELLHAGARVESALAGPEPPPARRAPSPASRAVLPAPRQPARPATPPNAPRQATLVSSPVSSPILRSMIPSRPINSTKPWNCLTQRSIDECRELIALCEQSWTKTRHPLFTPADRHAVMELLRVGKRLEQRGTGIFIDLWPEILSFCGRGWFEVVPEERPSIRVVANGIVVQERRRQEFGGLPEIRLDRDY